MPLIESKNADENFAKLPWATRFIYYELRTHLDPLGRIYGDTTYIISRMFPLDRKTVRAPELDRHLEALRLAGQLRRYPDSKGRPLIEVPEGVQSNMKKLVSKHESFNGGQIGLQLEHPPPSTIRRKEGRCVPHRPPFEKVKEPDSSDLITLLRTRMNGIYRRGPADAWSYAEEHALVDVSNRPEAIAELDHIELFRKKMPLEERRKFFPQSINSLLTHWTETLDKARVQCPLKSSSSSKTPPRPRSAAACGPEMNAAMLKESIAYLETNHPDSPMLESHRKQLKQLNPYDKVSDASDAFAAPLG